MVSVLVPAFNAEKTIRRCLDSVLSQTYNDIEVITANDGSLDTTLSLLLDYAQHDQRVNVIDQPNCGVAATRNTALDRANGEWILFVDADDWIEPNMIARLLNFSDGVDIVFCANDNADTPEQVKRTVKSEVEVWDRQNQMLEFMKHKRMTGMLWNKLIRRSVTSGCRFNEKTGYGEDAEFLWKVLRKSEKMAVTNEILYHHTIGNTSISHLSFSEKKYSAIPMWESINREVDAEYPELKELARERLMCAAVFSAFEIKTCNYRNKEHIKHLRAIARRNIVRFLRSKNVSIKFKLYAIAVSLGY